MYILLTALIVGSLVFWHSKRQEKDYHYKHELRKNDVDKKKGKRYYNTKAYPKYNVEEI